MYARTLAESSTRMRCVGLLAAILGVAVALRAYHLSDQSLWVDEVVTFLSSRVPVAQLISGTDVEDPNIPPLYYLMVHAILRLGNHEAILRLPSLIAGSLSILLFFLVVRSWLGDIVGLLSAAVMAISPFHVWYSQEARPYALLLFFSLLSLWCLQRSLADAAHWGWKSAFVVSSVGVVYTHSVGYTFIGFAIA